MKTTQKWRAALAAMVLVAGGSFTGMAADFPEGLTADYTGTVNGAYLHGEDVVKYADHANFKGSNELAVDWGAGLYMWGGSVEVPKDRFTLSGGEFIGKDVTVTSGVWANAKAETYGDTTTTWNGYAGFIDSTVTGDYVAAQGGNANEKGYNAMVTGNSEVDFVGSTVNVKEIWAKNQTLEDGKLQPNTDLQGGIVAFGLGTTATADKVVVDSRSAVAAGDFNFKQSLADISEYIGEYKPNGKVSTLTVKDVSLGDAKYEYNIGEKVLQAMKDEMLGGVLGAGENGAVYLKDGTVTGEGTLLAMGGTIQADNMNISGNVVAVDPEHFGDSTSGTLGGQSKVILNNSTVKSGTFGVSGKESTLALNGSHVSADRLYILEGGKLDVDDNSTLFARGMYIGKYDENLPDLRTYSLDAPETNTLNVNNGTLEVGTAGATIEDTGVLNVGTNGILKVQKSALEVKAGGTLNLAAKSSTYTVADADNNVQTAIKAENGATVTIDPNAQLFVENAAADGKEYKFDQVVTGSNAKFQTIYGSTVLTKLDENGKTFTTSDVASALPDAFAAKALTGALLSGKGDAYDFVNKALGKDAGDLTLAERAAHLNQLTGLTSLGGVAHGTYGFADTVSTLVEDHAAADDGIWASYIREDKTVDGFKVGNLSADYDLKYNGFVIGGDFAKSENSYTGVAFAYADGDVSSNGGVVSTKNDATYYSGSLYHVVNKGDVTYKADIGYTKSDNDLTQYNLGSKITGSADASAFHVGIRAEKNIAAGSTEWTPYVGLRYIRLATDDYTDSLGFKHTSDNAGIWNVPVGVKLTHKVQSGSWTYAPVAEIGYVFAFGDKDVEEALGYADAYDTFRSDVAESHFLGKIGFIASKDNVSYELHYGYQKGSDVQSNQWGVQVSYSF